VGTNSGDPLGLPHHVTQRVERASG
jgi:hypothetical protein